MTTLFALTLFLAAPEVPAVLTEARALINQGKPREALSMLDSLDPREPRVAYLQGIAYYHADDHVKAVEKLKPVVDKLVENEVEHQEAVQVLGLSRPVKVLEQGETVDPHFVAVAPDVALEAGHEVRQHLVDIDDEQRRRGRDGQIFEGDRLHGDLVVRSEG